MDIDIDWQDDRRSEGIDYVVNKYGEKSVCQIITFGTLKAKGVLRAVARVLGYPVAFQDKIAKYIPFDPKATIDASMEESQEFRDAYESDEDVRRVVEIAKVLEGVSTSTGTHAAGVLITDEKGVENYVPVWKTDDGVVAQYDKDILEELGLLKMDFLGLSTLTVISDAIKNIRKNYGVEVDLYELYQGKDTAPFQLICDGLTDGIFQLESAGMTKFMQELKPTSIEDLTAGVALFRPGPMQYIPNFIRNKHNPKLITYDFPELEPILKETYGMLCYQEQCMRIVVALGGYQKHHSDSFRKAIAKKKENLIAQHREWFINGREEKWEDGKMVQDTIPGALALGFNKAKVEKLYSEMEDFGRYCFNKSHAACYAVIAYVTAWLKYYYPAEFLAALIDKQLISKNSNAAVRVNRYIRHARDDFNINVLGPSINKSTQKVTALDKSTIAQSLLTKDVDLESIKNLMAQRENSEIESMEDFYRRCGSLVNKKAIGSWICSGAMDEFDIVRSQQLAGVPIVKKALSQIEAAQKRAEKSGKKSKITYESKIRFDEMIPQLNEISDETRLFLEKIYAGVYITGHPLDKYKGVMKNIAACPLSTLDYEINEDTNEIVLRNPNIINNQAITVVCIISEVFKTKTRKDGLPMAILTIEDHTMQAKALLFPDGYAEYKDTLNLTSAFKIQGRVKCAADEPPVIIVSSIEALELSMMTRIIFKCKNAEEVEAAFNEVKKVVGAGENASPVYIETDNMRVLLKSEYWVDETIFKQYSKSNNVTYERW